MKVLPNTIITFHEINDPKWLNDILLALKKIYNLVPVTDFENYYYHNANLKNACHLTFDDGDLSFYKNAMPLILKHKVPVSTYVSPLVAKERKNFWFQAIRGYHEEILIKIINKIIPDQSINIELNNIKGFLKTLQIETIWEIIRLYQKETNTSPKSPMNMTDKQLIEINSTGLVKIGAHTLNHPILINESYESSMNEITKSIDQLSEILNCETRYFVYPNGDFGEREINILREKGVKLAFSVQQGKISLDNNYYALPRSGSPFISDSRNSTAYAYSKSILQLSVGENRYYKLSKIWNSLLKSNNYKKNK